MDDILGDALADGVVRGGRARIDVHDTGSAWTERSVSMDDVCTWLLRWLEDPRVRRVELQGVRVVAPDSSALHASSRAGTDEPVLDLGDVRVDTAIVLRDCVIEPAVTLNGATIGRFELDGCDLQRGVRLEGASIGGRFRVVDSRLGATDRVSIDASAATVRGRLRVEGERTQLDGTLRLNGATIGGQLTIRDGARVAVDPDTGSAVFADRLQLDQSLYVEGGARLEGVLRLRGATINGQLTVRGGATIAHRPSNGRALDADRLTVTRSVFVTGAGTCLDGVVRLRGAEIGGQLTVRMGGRIAGDLDLSAASVGVLSILKDTVIVGHLDLAHARISRLEDEPGWVGVGGWRLAGIAIDALPGPLGDGSEWPTADRIAWLKKDESASLRPFTEVAGCYREAGQRSQARTIAVAGERHTSGRWRKLWAGLTIGYGYQPWRAAGVAAGVVLLVWAATFVFGGDDLFAPTDTEAASSCPADYPCLDRLVYLAETVLPVVDFGQRDAWRIDPGMRGAPWIERGQHLLDLLGWALALLVVASVTGVVRRE